MIAKVIALPVAFYSENKSVVALLEESGYYNMHNEVVVADIQHSLHQNDDAINNWLQWSADKRVSQGWWFINNLPGKYAVGFHPSERIEERLFTDRFAACAYFIKREIEDVMHSHSPL